MTEPTTLIIATWITATPLLAAGDSAVLPAHVDPDAVRSIPVQHDGRWMPIDTLARDVVDSVTGDTFYAGGDSVLWLLEWTFDSDGSANLPLIHIPSEELRRELQLPKERVNFSFNELIRHGPLNALFDQLARRPSDKKMDPLESKVAGLSEKLGTLQQVFHGEAIRLVPDPANPVATWRPIETLKPTDAPQCVQAWADLKKAFLADDGAAFADASQRLANGLAAMPAAYRPTPKLLGTELRYNRTHPFRLAWQIMLVGALLAAAAIPVGRRWFDGLAIVVLMAGFGVLTYGLGLRWQIAGRIPAANMFESLLFLSWGAGAFAILALLLMRDRFVPLTASAIGALALILADVLPLDHFIRPIAPVLMDTIWMSIHVPGIMISYSVLALATLIAHALLVVMALAPGRRQLIATLDSLHYWYVHVGSILLGAGIITGSMWAASSWGRYWGWDPKEVWSLVAFLGYLAMLHVRADRERTSGWVYAVVAVLAVALLVTVGVKLAPPSALKTLALVAAAGVCVFFVLARGPFAMALKSTVAFWLIIMTYIGVNFVLGIGLHSYGFGTGAVVHYMFLVGTIDLLAILFLTAVYAVRCGPRAIVGTVGVCNE